MLKQREFCNYLLMNKLVKPYDIINHARCTDRLNNIQNLRIENSKDNRLSCTITTRADSLGVVVYE